MKVMQEQQVALLALLSQLRESVEETFTGSREGLTVVDVDRYISTRDLLLQFYRSYDAEVYRVCFEERLSNRPCNGGA
jgi:hypothetical protein